nr:type II and III secretion system protein family protein [uncultured Devosia sp.]
MTHSFKAPRARHSGLLSTLLVAGLLATSSLSVVSAQESHISISANAYGATRSLEVELNKTVLVDLPAGAAEVIVSQPDVAAAIMRTRTRALIQGITGGDTNVFFLDDSGRTIQILDIKVMEEPSQVGNALETALARIIPGSNITVESVTLGGATNRVVLTGNVRTAEDFDRAQQVAIQFAGDPTNVANILDITGAQQVMLQVTVSEVKRDVAKQFGINLSGALSVGSINLNLNSTQTALTNGIGGNFPIGNLEINAAIRALESRNAARILAQPTLTALSGQPASFLAGGEIRYQSGFDDNNNPLFDFRQYGVSLEFTPVVKSNGEISMQIKTEVSEPTASETINKRSASTSVEIAPGMTLAIGGLLDERTSQVVSQLPGLGNIPILGALFRSREYQTEQTELVILVTPYLVAPSPANSIPVPTDAMVPASDAEGIFLGKLENLYGVGQTGEMRGGYNGSVGFVLD